ncbi:hypothetical protein [Cohnella nanjingensis]|uniref:DUF4359 domain-containing protein n=1 Tax=Cohnella nanjingensis TaxID=1387779 RepID=A0A7X0RU61_9BACL|nr:hypothetical protein [Cohnella nanjingensis]MBB6673596.1 hypothetical protein [Cohnella nanjingensis]
MLKKKTLKKLVIAVMAILVLAVVMSVTKPSVERYNRWALDLVSKRSDPKNPLMGLGLSIFGEGMIDKGTTVSDYGVVRVFHTEILGKRIKVVGILGTFIPMGKPETSPSAHEDFTGEME